MAAMPFLSTDCDDAAGEAQRFLEVIADMQREAAQRRVVVDDLRTREAAARAALSRQSAARDAAAALAAHERSEALRLRVESQSLRGAADNFTAEAFRLRSRADEWRTRAQRMGLDAKAPAPMGTDKERNSKGNNDERSDKEKAFSRALCVWRRLPQAAAALRSVSVLWAALRDAAGAEWRARLPALTEEETAVLALVGSGRIADDEAQW